MKKVGGGWLLCGLLSSFLAVGCTSPPVVVTREPPQERDEQRDPKPGPDYFWKRGHWAYDGGRDEYVWKPGVWDKERNNRVWIPGFWERKDAGWTWHEETWEETHPR